MSAVLDSSDPITKREYFSEVDENLFSYVMSGFGRDTLDVAPGSADLSSVSIHYETFCGFYPALVENVDGQNALCTIQVGKVELQIPFPVEVLKTKNVDVGDRFRWKPSDDGSVSPDDLELVEKRSLAVELPSDWLRTIVDGGSQDDDLSEIMQITPLVETKIGEKYFLLKAG